MAKIDPEPVEDAPVEDKAAAKQAAKEEKAAAKKAAAEKKAQEKLDKKNKKNKKKPGKKGGLLGKIVPTVIFLAVIGLLVAVIGFNFLGLREKYLRGVINKIPIVNTLLPAPTDDTTGTDSSDPLASMSNAELIAQIDSLQSQLDKANADKDDMSKRIDLYTSELASLKDVEAQQDQFKQDKAAFDELIATGDPAAYAKFYESISPENADILYKEVIGTVQQNSELKKYVSAISAMDENSAAKMLESLMTTDMNLVVMILKNMTSDRAGAIIEGMSADNAAAVVKQLAPAQG